MKNGRNSEVDSEAKEDMESYLKNAGLLTFRGIDGFETEQLSIVTNRLADATQRRVAAESVYNEVNGEGSPLRVLSRYLRSLTTPRFRIYALR